MHNLDLSSRSLWKCFHSELYFSPILSFSNINYSDSSSKLESYVSFDLEFLLSFISLAMAEATIVWIYLLLAKHLLSPTNLTQPTSPTQEDGQVSFIYLDCTCTTLYKLISCPNPFRGNSGLLTLFLYVITASSSEVLAVWFDPLLLVDEAVWWLAPACLIFLLVCDPLSLSWNIYSTPSSRFHRSTRLLILLEDESNPWTVS